MQSCDLRLTIENHFSIIYCVCFAHFPPFQLISLLYDIGAVGLFLPEYRLLDVKNMLCDTFSWPLINLACGCGYLMALNLARDSLVNQAAIYLPSLARFTLIQVKLAAENDQQYPSHAIVALRQGSYSKFPEIVAFGRKLAHSLQAAQVAAQVPCLVSIVTNLAQVHIFCGWLALAEKCGGGASAADSRSAMGPKGGGDVSSREILNGKLSSGLDALVGLGEEEMLNDNRDFNCLVRPYSLRRVNNSFIFDLFF